ncbi:MAG: universal stress protein [bacterium]|nr:universal stress protein [bacterium]
MKKYPKILLPTNLSQSACDAADFIVSFLGRNAEYELLNSFPLVYRSGFYNSFQNYTPDYDEIPLEKLKRERNRLIKKFGNQSIEIKAMYGDPVRDLIKTAENSADLVVMGEEQFSGWSYQKVSKVETAMVHLEIPLIFVPNMDAFERVDRVVLIQDSTSKYRSESMELLRQLCDVSGAQFQVVYVDDESTCEEVILKTKWSLEDTTEEITIVKNRLDLNELLADTLNPHTIIVSNIEFNDSRLAESIQKLFEDKAIVQTKLLMPKKSNENFLRGA